MFIISDAKVEDISSIIEIAEKTWWPTYQHILTPEQIHYMLHAIYAPEILESQITLGLQRYLMLRNESGTQGFASYGPRQDDPDTYKVHKLYVLPDNHKRGYGRALLEEIKTRLARMDKHRLDLNVNRHNPALKFYEGLGFRIVREEDVPIGPYWMNDYVMTLEF